MFLVNNAKENIPVHYILYTLIPFFTGEATL